MLKQLLHHLQRHHLCKTTDKILLAVSGGIDSMVMLHLLHKAGFSIGVAHCNFQLRGDDSLKDEIAVRTVCEEKSIPFHCERFQTLEFAQARGLSIQLAARQLRYKFFEQTRANGNYDYIATAHNLNDSLETVILNLAKGTGLRGLAGIPVKNGSVIRPLLFASRDRIVTFAKAQKVTWREDASNAHDHYRRNFVRHNIVPLLGKINPNVVQTFSTTVERIQGALQVNEAFLDSFRSTAVTENDDVVSIDLEALKRNAFPQVVLWELVGHYGFNYDQCCNVVATKQSGKKFSSITHSLTVDRKSLVITKLNRFDIQDITIDEGQQYAFNGEQTLSLEISNHVTIERMSSVAQLDAAKIIYPLRWRKWKAGDFFQPLGMKSRKKLSDLLIDLKISAPDKEKVTVIESAGKIVWVVGHRISDECKITPETTTSLRLETAKVEREKIS